MINFKLEGNEAVCTARIFRNGELVATATSNAKLDLLVVTYNRGPGKKAEHDIFNSCSFLKLTYTPKMIAALNGETLCITQPKNS